MPSAKLAFILAKIAITIAAFFFVARAVDPGKLWICIKATNPLSFAAAVAVVLLQIPLVGVRWRWIIQFITRGGDTVPSVAKVQQMTWISLLFSQVLPFVAGDAMRVLFLRTAGSSLRVAIKSTLLDRAAPLVTIFAMALPAVLFSALLSAAPVYAAPIRGLIFLGLIGSFGVMVVAPRLASLLAKSRLAPVAEILMDLRRIFFVKHMLLRIGGMCVVVHFMSMLVFWLLARGQGLQIGFGDAAAIVPMLILVATIPLAIAGWGVREAFLVTLLATAGVGNEQALLLSISFGFVPLIASLPGAVVLAFVNKAAASDREVAESIV